MSERGFLHWHNLLLRKGLSPEDASEVATLICDAITDERAGGPYCEQCRHLWANHTRGGMCAGDDGRTVCYCSRIPEPTPALGAA